MDIGKQLYEILAGFLILIFGLAITPTIYDQSVTAAENMTGIAATLMPFVIVVWVMVILIIAVSLINASRKA